MTGFPNEDPVRSDFERSLAAYRNGEDGDLSAMVTLIWELLYAQIPRLTLSRHKEDQHRILEEYLVELGFPGCADLQYIVGPVLWYAREKGIVPSAQAAPMSRTSWELNGPRYEEARKTLREGVVSYGDWMRDALRSIFSEQQ